MKIQDLMSNVPENNSKKGGQERSEKGVSPLNRRLYGMKNTAAISLNIDSHCKAIAALFFSIPFSFYLRTLRIRMFMGLLITKKYHA